jgi:hypothetical protein
MNVPVQRKCARYSDAENKSGLYLSGTPAAAPSSYSSEPSSVFTPAELSNPTLMSSPGKAADFFESNLARSPVSTPVSETCVNNAIEIEKVGETVPCKTFGKISYKNRKRRVLLDKHLTTSKVAQR